MFADKKNVNPVIPRAIIFDWDNTLVDAWGAVVEAVNEVRTVFGQELFTLEDTKRASARSARNLFREWYGDEWQTAHDIFYRSYQKNYLLHLKSLPGAHELLEWLKEIGIPSFVVSNKRGDILRQEAKYLGWNNLFAGLAGSLDAPRDKPARDPVDLALGYAGLKADDPAIWFIGDTHSDVECARNAGCTPVLIHNISEAEFLGVRLAFSSCHELLEMLYSILPTRQFAISRP